MESPFWVEITKFCIINFEEEGDTPPRVLVLWGRLFNKFGGHAIRCTWNILETMYC